MNPFDKFQLKNTHIFNYNYNRRKNLFFFTHLFYKFTTVTGGIIDLIYTSPALEAEKTGKAWIQVVEVDDEGRVLDLMGQKSISLSGSSGHTAPLPKVLTVSPENDQKDVSLNSNIVAQFSEPLDVSTVTGNNFSIKIGSTKVPGTLNIAEGIMGPNTIVTFTPDDLLSPNSSYTIYIGTGIKSEEGNSLFQYVSSSFSTGIMLEDSTAPYVLNVNPPGGMTAIPINSCVSIEFSETMNAVTINTSTLRLSCSGGDISGKIVKEGPALFSLIPDALLLPDTSYTIAADASLTDTAGNPMGSAFTSTFTTQISKKIFISLL